jgi:hypothetical protein
MCDQVCEPDMSTSDGICILGGTYEECCDRCIDCKIYQDMERSRNEDIKLLLGKKKV